MNAQGVAVIAAVRAAEVKMSQQRVRNLLTADAPVHAIEMPGANHYVFLADGAFVLNEVRSFLERLPSN